MAISLDELKRQREQIQKHLDWLDAKIHELRPEAKALESEKPAATALPQQTTAEDTKESTGSEGPISQLEKSDTPVSTAELDAPTYVAKTQNELMRAKIGCLVFFILSIALFLFLLFGLPYLL